MDDYHSDALRQWFIKKNGQYPSINAHFDCDRTIMQKMARSSMPWPDIDMPARRRSLLADAWLLTDKSNRTALRQYAMAFQTLICCTNGMGHK